MEERNLELGIPLTREQWEQVARRAADLGREQSGFEWSEEEPEQIRLYLHEEEARGLWSDYVSGEETYGAPDREVAQFVFNGGSPYARVEAPPTAQPPMVTQQEEQGMQLGLERWVRDKWEQLLRESGLHYDRGHAPYD